MNGERNLKDRRIALIGGAGFIGHHLAVALAREGAQPEIVDSLQVNNLWEFMNSDPAYPHRNIYLRMIQERMDILRNANIPVHIQDARDYHALSRILGQIQPQVIIHLAAVAHAEKSNKNPYTTFDHSLRTLENALDAARGFGVEHFIYFSSSMAYGDFQTEEVDEEHPLNPIGIYGALKVAGEKIVIAYQQVFGLPYTIVRPSALYGPRCVSRRVGQIFIESALRGGVLKVEGDGSDRLDFTYIDDLTDGILRVLRSPKALNQIFNLTYGQARTINDLVRIIQTHFSEVKVERVERNKLMPIRGTLSIRKARDLLGYDPQHPLEVGFPKYIQWYRQMEQAGRL